MAAIIEHMYEDDASGVIPETRPADRPAAAPLPRPRSYAQPDPEEQLSRLRLALADRPGPALAAAADQAVDPVRLVELGQAGMLELVRAGHALASWAEWLQLRGLEALYQSRRGLGSRDLELLESIQDDQELVEASQRLQAEADDLAGRSVVAEAAAVCGTSEYSLGRRLDAALELTRLPDTDEALRTGELDWPKAQSVADATRGLSEAAAAAVEARCLPLASRLHTRGLQAALAAAVYEVDPAMTERRHRAARGARGVSFRLGRDLAPTTADGVPDGTGEMTARMGALELFDLRRHLDLLAESARTPGDKRTLNQRRVDTLLDVFAASITHVDPPAEDASASDISAPDAPAPSGNYRVNPTALPALPAQPTEPAGRRAGEPHIVVTIGLDTLLGLNETPGDLAGYGPIPAFAIRDLATRGTWRCAATDAHGTVLGLGRSTFTPRYRPPGATARLVRQRDRTCVFPGCRRQARRCDLDHRTPHRLGGATCECNLQALCGNHHRLKHEAGFTVTADPDPDAPPGTLTWTTPTGHRVRRHPQPANGTRLPDGPPF
jgi:hypothetical protein